MSFLTNNPFEIEPLSPANSDLIVEQWSQRNATGPGDYPNAGSPWAFELHIHAGVPVVGSLFQLETESDAISIQIGELLSQPRSSFQNGVLH